MQPAEKVRPIGAEGARAGHGPLPVALAHFAVLLLRALAVVILAAPLVIALALLLR
jgi:hypothetical protein